MAKVEDISINTIIGPDSFIHGDVNVPGFIRVDGDIDGSISTTGRVIIGEKARIRGNIEAKSVTVGGIVQGDIIAPDNVIILSSAVIIGAVLTQKIRIDENVLFSGFCFAKQNREAFDTALKNYTNQKALQASGLAQKK
ncbi:polymer-forming cytoskeletal family protein [Treponema phagedenis]|nr:polymer-forming cytoskeletal protein [Treponema phagedenis]EFW36720.1 hypothetical protein HMPREF9554_02836 [Treponema phagedenis F0421]NVP24136.1 polymer-forming cytoskeletal protein [Treponema phagedenis]NVP25657.1 polymer-forming cytoskeletal protein [Treponema phagedenis]QEJ96289.1 polymer-forming cytoskeletal protein [Treponema phagedenis]QEK00066.1 polymer-forming cytoskeletal protein [Treponema phagedenis]